jgi:hypothetical protein
VGLFGNKWSWEKLQKHKEICVAKALTRADVKDVMFRRKVADDDLREFYVRLSEAGTEPEQREIACLNATLLDRYWQAVREGQGRIAPAQLEMFAHWIRTNPASTVPQ